jgi:hypothetical protein
MTILPDPAHDGAQRPTTSPAHVVAEHCPGCGEVHFPQQPGTGQRCRTCRYYRGSDEPSGIRVCGDAR